MVNNSGSWVYVSPVGAALFIPPGDSPPSGSTVLVCPGGTIPDELAARYEIADRLKGDGEPAVQRDPAGNPIVVRGGKAYAASVLAEDDPARKAVEAAAKAEDEAKAEAKAKAKKAGPGADVKAAAKAAGDDEGAGTEDAGDADAADEPGVKVKPDAQGKAVRLGRDAGVEDKAVHKSPASPRKK